MAEELIGLLTYFTEGAIICLRSKLPSFSGHVCCLVLAAYQKLVKCIRDIIVVSFKKI